MGILSTGLLGRSALLACDACDRVFTSQGGLSDSARRDSSPDALAAHFRKREDLAQPAIEAGWLATLVRGETTATWICPSCARGSVRRMGPPLPDADAHADTDTDT
jgi:hypothetical protein